MMSLLEKRVEYRPSRPPTAVYPDRRQVAEYRDREFPPTATHWARVFCINLEGAFFSPGALKEMLLPVGQAIREGAYGAAALVVVTSDDGTIEFLEALAEKHALPIFLSPSPDAPLSDARPIGALTTAEMRTYGLIRNAGGEVTSSRIADLEGIEVNAAGNRAAALNKKGYIYRESRSRREGDAFVDLISAAEQSCVAAASSADMVPAAENLRIPESVRESVERVASSQGSAPEEVLVRAWNEYVEKHKNVLNAESKEIGQMLREGNREALASYVNRGGPERARRAAARIKR
jgi:hypothetical protein